jgi:tRNA (Thr-GGU) A37 N-methylase
VGIFAQRKKSRPNRLGLSTCRLLSVDGLALSVAELDAIDGTPIVDIKPYALGFAPRREEVRQPNWISELMADYFAKRV